LFRSPCCCIDLPWRIGLGRRFCVGAELTTPQPPVAYFSMSSLTLGVSWGRFYQTVSDESLRIILNLVSFMFVCNNASIGMVLKYLNIEEYWFIYINLNLYTYIGIFVA
jgi:hypothetical protein